MSKENFTPAPWTVVLDDEHAIVISERDRDSICFVDTPMGIDESEICNAYLIAAAPELYKFVEFFTTLTGQLLLRQLDDYGEDIYNEAKKLTKKARGEE